MAIDRGWNWHIWELHPVTKKPFKYVGFMNDEVAAMEWIKKNGKEHYRILNFGPNAIAKGSQTHSPKDKVKKVAKTGKVQEEMAKARAESIRKDRERIKQREAEKAKRAEQERKNQEAMKGIRDDAAGLLVKHKEDEQADLDAGINR